MTLQMIKLRSSVCLVLLLGGAISGLGQTPRNYTLRWQDTNSPKAIKYNVWLLLGTNYLLQAQVVTNFYTFTFTDTAVDSLTFAITPAASGTNELDGPLSAPLLITPMKWNPDNKSLTWEDPNTTEINKLVRFYVWRTTGNSNILVGTTSSNRLSLSLLPPGDHLISVSGETASGIRSTNSTSITVRKFGPTVGMSVE